MDERKRKSSTGPNEYQRETPVEQLWERSREERKETNRKPSTRTRKKDMRNQVQEKGESDKTKVKSHTGKTTVR